jgi:hypothetical protein
MGCSADLRLPRGMESTASPEACAGPSERLDETSAGLRAVIRTATHAAVTFGHGPRYLHPTGQLHKEATDAVISPTGQRATPGCRDPRRRPSLGTAWRPREAAYRVVRRQLDACGKDRAVPGTEHGFTAGFPGPLMPLGPAGPPVSAAMPPRADGPQQAQRGQPERRVTTEVLILAAVQRGGEETRLRRGRVALGSPGAAAALAAPHHRLPIAREAVPVAEDFATQHRDSD